MISYMNFNYFFSKSEWNNISVHYKKKDRINIKEKERDASAEAERLNSHFRLETEKFTTKSNQGKLKIIPYKEYYNMVNEIKRLKEEISKYKK